jgi:RNA-binding protein 26
MSILSISYSQILTFLQTTVKGEVVAEQAAKRPKVEIVADIGKVATPRSSFDPGSAVVSPHTEMVGDKNKSVDNVVSHSPKTNTTTSLQDPMSLKQPNRPLAPVGAPFLMNRYKLDNRPTGFRIIPPLPAGLASVSFSLSLSLSCVINKIY